MSRGVVRAMDRHVLSRSFALRYRPGRLLVEVLARLDRPPRDVYARRGSTAGNRAIFLLPHGVEAGPRVIWIHGGAFCFNSPSVYAAYAGRLAKALGTGVLAMGYRRAPENPYPAALNDVLETIDAVTKREGPVLLAGDSAGGNLALSAAIALRDRGGPTPRGLYLMSPWVDLTGSGESVRANDGKDATLRAPYLPPLARAYAAGLDLGDPRLSPLGADLSALPPCLIQAGGDELFLSECTQLATNLQAVGNRVELSVFEGMWHDFAAHAGSMSEADEALEQVARWAAPLLV